jgi:hypothetical protein
MEDLEKAKRILKDRNLSLVIVKDGVTIFSSDSPGIDGLLEAVEKLGERLSGASVADKIVGKAAALLLAYSNVVGVYASTLSRRGLATLSRNGIPVEYDLLVPEILDKEKRDLCPFEKFVSSIESPSHAFEKLKNFVESLRRKEDPG